MAASNRLPGIYAFRFYATEGGLISYGIDTLDLFRRGASYIDRILKGDNPADLPVQAPTRFELVINLSTAKSLSLDVPLQLQQRSFRDMSSFGYAECRVDPAMAQYRSKLALMLQELFSFMVLPYATSGL